MKSFDVVYAGQHYVDQQDGFSDDVVATLQQCLIFDITAAFGSHHQVQGRKTRRAGVESEQVQMCKTRLRVVSLASMLDFSLSFPRPLFTKDLRDNFESVLDLDVDSMLHYDGGLFRHFSPCVRDLATDPAAGIANRVCWDQGPLEVISPGGRAHQVRAHGGPMGSPSAEAGSTNIDLPDGPRVAQIRPQGYLNSMHVVAGPPSSQPRRGLRRKADKVARHETCIWTCNVTSWTSARLLVDWLVASDLAVDCLMLQETMRVAHEVPTVKSQSAQHKMHCLVGPAVVTEAVGKSAGTILMSRWNRGLAAASLPEGLVLDSSRLQLAHWPGIVPGGIIVGTIYLHDGCKVHDEKNQTLLRQLVAALKCIKLPFVVGGDWNMAPMVLASSGIPDALSAKIVHPVSYTYHSGGAASVLDFFLVSGIIAPAVVECKAYDGSPVSKHSPVRLKFSSDVFARTMTTLQKPPMYKHLNITSVANKPVCTMPHLGSCPGTKQLSSFYSDWARLAEDELNSLHGIQAGVCRRGQPLKYVTVRHAVKGSQHVQADPAASCFRQVSSFAKCYVKHRGSSSIAHTFWIRALKSSPRLASDVQWGVVRRHVRLWPLLDSCDILQLAEVWAAEASLREDRALRDRLREWTLWVNRAFDERGGSKVFSSIRGSGSEVSFLLPGGSGGDLHNLDIVEAASSHAKPWLELWRVHFASFDLDSIEDDGSLACPLPSVQQFRDLTATYKTLSAVGCDHWQAKFLGRLSDNRIEDLIHLMSHMMMTTRNPEQLNLLIVHLIPKGDVPGAVRPIGLFSTITRLLDRWFRWQYGRHWASRQPHQYHLGVSGQPIEKGLWRQACVTEYSTVTGRTAATILLDIVKAFENVGHQVVLSQARKQGFHLGLLKWLLAMFQQPRSIAYQQMLCPAVRATCSIVPGSSHADLLMRLMLQPVVELVRSLAPYAIIAVVVDDLQVTLHGGCDTVQRDMVKLVDRVFPFMEEQLRLPLSRPKLALVSNIGAVAQAIGRRRALLGRAVVKSVRNLGMDYAAGARTFSAVRKDRISKVFLRAKRLAFLRAGPVRAGRIARQALNPMGLFGVGVTGIADGCLRRLRTAMHIGIIAKPMSRSCTVDLAMLSKSHTDPAVEGIARPIELMSAGISCGWLARPMILTLHDHFLRRPVTIGQSFGPIGVAMSNLVKLGWQHRTAFTWSNDMMTTIDFDTISPFEVKKLVRQSVIRFLWRQASTRHRHLAHLVFPPLLQPLLEMLNPGHKSFIGHRGAGLLRVFLAGKFSYISGSVCKCGQGGFESGGTLLVHMFWDCPITYHVRREYGMYEPIVRAARAYADDPFFGSLFVADPRYNMPGPCEPPAVKWWLNEYGGEALFSGPCFGDGSVVDGGHEWSARAGWSIVEVTSIDRLPVEVRRSVCGTLPGLIQTISGAELYCVLIWLRHLSPLYTEHVYYSDSSWVVQGWNREFSTTEAWTPFRGIWESIELLRHDCPGVKVLKVKAHTTAKDVAHSVPLQCRREGNIFADGLAKEGARMHPTSAVVNNRLAKCNQLLLLLAPYYARLLVWIFDAKAQPDVVTYSRRCRYFVLPKHIFATGPGGLSRCVRCLRLRVDCRGGLLECTPDGARPHYILQLGGGMFCGRCGSYSFRQTKNLAIGCAGTPPSVEVGRRLGRMLDGRHPISGKILEGTDDSGDLLFSILF